MLHELCKPGGKVHITDVNAYVFCDLLYLYGGEVSEETLGTNQRVFINAADRYGTVPLKLRAKVAYVQLVISLDNAMDTLLYADFKNYALLKEAVIELLVEYKDEAIKKMSFDGAPDYFMKHLLVEMASRDRKKDTDRSKANDYSIMRVDSSHHNLHRKGLDIDSSREAMVALLEGHS